MLFVRFMKVSVCQLSNPKMRTPVVTSNISPMKEVAGGGAVLVNPEDILSIREGILRIINDESLRNKLVEKGLINIKRFETSRVAAQYENLYREIIETENILKD